jgi:hypothetical protein
MMDQPSIKLRKGNLACAHIIRILVGFLLLFASACQPLTATVLPTPEIIRVEYTPALGAWTAPLNRCASSLPEIGLATAETPAGQLDPTRVNFALRFGPQPDPAQNIPSPFFAAVLSSDEVVVVVTPSNPISSLTPQQISAIFSGQHTGWSDLDSPTVTPLPTDTGRTIQAWSYPAGDDVRQVFDQAFMQSMAPSDQTYLAPDAGAMLEALGKNPGAIGYLLKSQVTSTVQKVNLNGIPAFNLTQPILALSSKEPLGNTRQLLLCLQGK